MDFYDIAIATVKRRVYRVNFLYMREDEAINLFSQKKWYIVKHKKLLSYIKMVKEVITFCDIEIERHKFYYQNNPIFYLLLLLLLFFFFFWEDVDNDNVF